jgi:archaellum biogenesis protein FlaJ (TadC family)
MSVSYLILFVIMIGAVMGLFGVLLLASNDQIFFPYSIESHTEAGNAMLILTIVIAVVFLPAILINQSLRHELRRQ